MVPPGEILEFDEALAGRYIALKLAVPAPEDGASLRPERAATKPRAAKRRRSIDTDGD